MSNSYSNDKNSGNYYCNYCSKNVIGNKNNSFLNTPKYLIIEFIDLPKKKKQIEPQIDLTYYRLSNKGPRKYLLYALICRDNNGEFLAYIKINGCWGFYSGYDKCLQVPFESIQINQIDPYFAIYEGIDYN